MRELILNLDQDLGRRAGLEVALRDAIRNGRLPAGATLPSTRSLAKDHGLARATVVEAYEQLTVEGYLRSRQGSGTVVADLGPAEPAHDEQERALQTFTADFRPGVPDVGAFPRSSWLGSVRRVLREAPEAAFRYGDPLGTAELRTVLAQYLGRTRAVAAAPAAVSVFGGVTSAIGFVGEALRRRGLSTVGVEDPGHPWLRQVLETVGAEVVPIPIDDEGLDVSALDASGAAAVLTCPAHQYPLGVTMSADRRSELVDWARSRDGLVIEDDYDGHYRYDRKPIGSLQGLDPERVLYVGTLSKSLSPVLRLAWLVVPPWFRDDLAAVKHRRAGVSGIDQLALADFIDRGELDRQIRTTRATYNRRRLQVTEQVGEAAPWLTLPRPQSGLHVTALAEDHTVDTSAAVRAAAERSIGLIDLHPHWMGPANRAGFVLGYSRPSTHRFPEALDRLTEFLASIDPGEPGGRPGMDEATPVQ